MTLNTKPLLIAIGGLSGSGKTSLATAMLGVIPNTVHLDSDRTRKKIFGVAETTRLPKEAYTLESTQHLIIEMDRLMKENIADGKNIIITTMFDFPKAREDKEKLAQETGARFIGIWLQADTNVLLDRVVKRINDASDANADIVKMQSTTDVGTISWHKLDAAQSREDVLKAVLEIVK